MLKAVKTTFFLLILVFSLFPIVNAQTDFTDSYLNENYISSYNQLYVNTTAGEIRLGPESAGSLDNKYALGFDGSDDYLKSDSVYTFTYTTKSIAFWYRLENGETTTNFEYFQTGFGFFFRQGTNDNQFYLTNTTHAIRYRGFTIDTDGDWHFKVLNCVYVAGQPSFIEEYDDNVLTQNRTSSDYQQAQTPTKYIEIATCEGAGGIVADFDIDHFQIYNRSMTTTEISQNYNSGDGKDIPYNTTDLDIFYRFNEGTGDTTTDDSGAYDATLYNHNSSIWITGKVQQGTGYYSDGIVYSTALLSGLHATNILNFTVDCNIPTNTTLDIWFSQNNSTWFDNNGVVNNPVSLSNGSQIIDLRSLYLEGLLIYRVNFTSSDDAYTPKLNNIILTYEGSMTEIALLNMVFVLVVIMLIMGILGLWRPIFALVSLCVSLVVILPLILAGTIDSFLLNLSVISLLFQSVCLTIGATRRYFFS